MTQRILEYIDYDVPHDASHGYHWRKVRDMVAALDTPIVPQIGKFAGSDYSKDRDGKRLTAQYMRVFSLMSDGDWRSLNVIATLTKDPEASVSAQLRHMRKEKFGNHTVNKKHIADGFYLYQLVVNEGQMGMAL